MTNICEMVLECIKKERKKSNKAVFCVAIDGGSASGKTTLCKYLEKALSAQVIHCDDFFIPISERDKRDLSLGNLDFERLENEVLKNLGKKFSYRPFDCKTQSLGDWVFVEVSDVILIEGAYSHHPSIRKYFDLALFLNVSKSLQAERVKNRAPEKAQAFFEKWIPM